MQMLRSVEMSEFMKQMRRHKKCPSPQKYDGFHNVIAFRERLMIPTIINVWRETVDRATVRNAFPKLQSLTERMNKERLSVELEEGEKKRKLY